LKWLKVTAEKLRRRRTHKKPGRSRVNLVADNAEALP
jgi:hypothetical protein